MTSCAWFSSGLGSGDRSEITALGPVCRQEGGGGKHEDSRPWCLRWWFGSDGVDLQGTAND